MSFWDIIWFIVVSFVFVAYLMMLFSIIGDLFGDRSTSGWAKAAWMIALIFLPFLAAIVYLVARGDGMARRRDEAIENAMAKQADYIRNVAGSSPTAEIANAKSMLDEGVIDQAEFNQIKQRSLAK